MAGTDPRDLGRVFNDVPELYDRVRPAYPDELFADLVAITGMGERSSVLEVGCGTGQATRPLAALGCSLTAVEPGAGMAMLARQRLAAFRNVEVETSTFERWDDRDRRFDVLVAASSWHWVDPSDLGRGIVGPDEASLAVEWQLTRNRDHLPAERDRVTVSVDRGHSSGAEIVLQHAAS